MYRLRRKLSLCAENGGRLSSIRTHGYRLDEPTVANSNMKR
ncbi:hypothetical protein CIC12_05785 [Burkholderia sp. SG-MS1]|nr:hypothetical protein [Paraburkholderia sp. SG-MS1]